MLEKKKRAPMSEETKAKIKAKKLERDKNPEYQAKINAALAKRRAEDPDYGRRVSEGLKQWNQTDEGKAVQRHKSDGQVIAKAEFYVSEAGQEVKRILSQKTKEYLAAHGHPNAGKHLDNSAAVAGANRRRAEVGHPWQGLHHSDETKQKLREKRAAWFKTPEGAAHKLVVGNAISVYYADPAHREVKSQQQLARLRSGELKPFNSKAGRRADLGGQYFRSRLEANFARILQYHNEPYEFEPRDFVLTTGHHYVPDFYLPSSDTYVETKGFLSDKDIEKYAQFKKDYPNVKWVMLKQSSEEWKCMEFWHKDLISAWEGVK